MPRYDRTTKQVDLIENDICDGCEYFMQACYVWVDLEQNQAEAKYHDKHIVKPGDEDGRKDYIGCKSYRPYQSPQDKEDNDPNPHFGRRLSNQEFNIMNGMPPDTKPTSTLPD